MSAWSFAMPILFVFHSYLDERQNLKLTQANAPFTKKDAKFIQISREIMISSNSIKSVLKPQIKKLISALTQERIVQIQRSFLNASYFRHLQHAYPIADAHGTRLASKPKEIKATRSYKFYQTSSTSQVPVTTLARPIICVLNFNSEEKMALIQTGVFS